MEEELLKRNTDCVYFLASPLTCKKGSECEYRHNEMARLNPRDCWYWMSGSCLNPSCAFRHPPLDAQSQTSSEPALNQPAVAAAPVNKTNAPCYFFHNGFCNKGEKCSYLHGPFDNGSTWKPSKSDPVNPDGLPAEKKASAGSDTGSAPIATHATSFKTGHQQAARIKRAPHPEIHLPAPNNVAEQDASPLTPVSQYEDSIAGRSISPLAAAGSFQRRSHTSSPGFDVLVDNGSEELDGEEDYEYVPDHDREGRDLIAQRHDYEENAEDDLAYPASSILYEKRRRDYEDHSGAELHYSREGAANSRGSVLDRIMPRKRTLPGEFSSNGQDSSVDLRDVLKRRRMVDDHSRNHSSRRLESSRLISRSREMPQSYSERRLHERRDSRSGNSFSRSRLEDGGRLRRSPFDRSRLQEKPQLLPSEISGKAASRHRSYDEDSAMFTGPKTLVAIIDEKRAKEDGDPSERSSSLGETVQENFRGPKTLREILEEKRRSGSVEQGNNDRN